MSEHKDIDKFFQQRSAQHDFEYNPDAWAEMEILLDKEERSHRFWWWLSGLFVVAFCLFALFFDRNKAMDSNAASLGIAQTSNKKVEQPSQGTRQEVGTLSNDEKKPIDYTAIKKKKIQESASKTAPSKTIMAMLAPKDMSAKSVVSYLNKGYHAGLVGDDLAAKKQAIRLNQNQRTSAKLEKMALLPTLLPSPLLMDAPDIDIFTLAQKVNLKQRKADNQWLIGAFFASEISSVELETISKNNFRFGGQTVYRFKRKYGTSIGVSYTRKKYKVNEGDYTPPKGFWTRKIAPQSTQATTDILEVPVTIEFFPKGYKQNGLYTNLGLTSYFMLKEKYRYSYDLPDPDLIREWHTEKENKHWFGVGQIAIGYQRVMSPKVYAQLGSYVQMPLTGIGHGQVNLWSFGLDWKMNFLMY